MAKTGRKPKPTAVKKAAGNPGRRPLNNNEPRFKPVNLPCPSQLQGEARIEWERVAPELAKHGVLTKLDEKALLGYCVAWARWCDAEAHVRRVGAVIATPNGYPVQNPYQTIADKSLEQMRKFAVEFGMTPSSRSNIHVIPEDQDKSGNVFADLAKDNLTVN